MQEASVVRELQVACTLAGGVAIWAADAGVTKQYVYQILSGRQGPGERVLKALGLERVTSYRRAVTVPHANVQAAGTRRP